QQRAHKTNKYKLTSTPAQVLELGFVLSRCQTLYNVALAQRTTWWQRIDTPHGSSQGMLSSSTRPTPRLPDGPARPVLYSWRHGGPDADAFHTLDRSASGRIRLWRPPPHSHYKERLIGLVDLGKHVLQHVAVDGGVLGHRGANIFEFGFLLIARD